MDNFNEAQENTTPQETDAESLARDRRAYIVFSILCVVLAVLLTFIITYVVLTTQHAEEINGIEDAHQEELDRIGEFRTIAELYNSLPEELRNIEMYKKLAYLDYYYRTMYAGKINEDELIYGLCNGYIIGAGDFFGGYYTADEFNAIMTDTEGSSVGIGVYVTTDSTGEFILISSVMQNGPAHIGGMLPGDIITHIDGKSILELGGYYGALSAIKGEVGTHVRVGFLREGEEMEVSLVRALVTIESVVYTPHQTESGVGVIRITEFNNQTDEQFIAAVKKAVGQDGCHSLVFDLRENTGGTLDSVVKMLDFMLPQGPVVTVRYNDGTSTTYSSDEKGEEFEALFGTDIKMAVLTNGHTASAAELFTCALKDYEKATIVGTKTYGKGCGQNVFPMSDGSGLLITTFLYDPPKSGNYNGVGIFPDVSAELSEEASNKNIFDLAHDEDDQLKAALEALK